MFVKGYSPSDITRKRMSESAKKRCTPEWRKHLSELYSTPLPISEIKELYEHGMTQTELAVKFKTTQKVIWRAMKIHQIKARVAAKRNQFGSNNDYWKGDSAKYAGFHRRVGRVRGNPNICELLEASFRAFFGGIELGLESTGGFKTIWHSEIEPYPSAVLEKNFPGVPNYGDITKIDWSKVEKPDLICGGFPCQDISVAGKGKGIREGARSGLWREFARCLREVRPRYALVENVPMLANRGLTIVLDDLAALGYDAEWGIVSASSVGAPHKRERLFIIAYAASERCDKSKGCAEAVQQSQQLELLSEEGEQPKLFEHVHGTITSDSSCERCECGCRSGQSELPCHGQGLGVEGHREDERCERVSTRKLESSVTSNSKGSGQLRAKQQEDGCCGDERRCAVDADAKAARNIDVKSPAGDASDSKCKRVERNISQSVRRLSDFSVFKDIRRVEDLFNRPDIPEPLIRGNSYGLPKGLDGFIRKERTKALGNSVVPQVAKVVGEMILRREKELTR